MNIRLAREQQRAALTLLRELSLEEQGMLEQVEEHLDSMGLTLPEVRVLFSPLGQKQTRMLQGDKMFRCLG